MPLPLKDLSWGVSTISFGGKVEDDGYDGAKYGGRETG